MIIYDDSTKRCVLTELEPDGFVEVNGHSFKYWNVDFGNVTLRIGEYDMDEELRYFDMDDKYVALDEKFAYYASYDDTLELIKCILLE